MPRPRQKRKPRFHYLLLALALFFIFRFFSQYRFYTLSSPSMNPDLPVGTLVVVKKTSNYLPGDVVTFAANVPLSGSAHTITHRIQAMHFQNGKIFFSTKGDANQAPDPLPVTPQAVEGKVLFSSPFVGRYLNAVRSQLALFILTFTTISLIPLMFISLDINRRQ